MLYLHVHVLYYSGKFTGNTYFTTTCIILQTTSQLESFMQSITSAVRLMDTRLVHITTKLSEMTKRQEDMELYMRLLHESVRKIPIPGTQFQPTDSRPQPMLSPHYHSSQNCSTPAFLDTEDEPWWQTESLLMEKTTSEPVGGQQSSLPQATCARTPPAPTSSSNRQQSRLAPATLSHPPPATGSSNQKQPRMPPATPPTTPASSSIQHSDFLTAEEMISIRISSSSRRNFATNVNRQIFSEEERMTSNVSGTRGKLQLDSAKVAFIKRVAFQQFPLKGEERAKKAWSDCIEAIDEANRRLNRKK